MCHCRDCRLRRRVEFFDSMRRACGGLTSRGLHCAVLDFLDPSNAEITLLNVRNCCAS